MNFYVKRINKLIKREIKKRLKKISKTVILTAKNRPFLIVISITMTE